MAFWLYLHRRSILKKKQLYGDSVSQKKTLEPLPTLPPYVLKE